MNNFQASITPAEAVRGGDSRSLGILYVLASIAPRRCAGCGRFPAWRYAGLDLCFTCVTGEQDASRDCELSYHPPTWPLPVSATATGDSSLGSDHWMEKQGFAWDAVNGLRPRWVHRRTGVVVERNPEWDNAQWRQVKIDQATRVNGGRAQRRAGDRRTGTQMRSQRQRVAFAVA
jgi:hypothetical protein